MRRDELSELQYITPIQNLVSICQLGILSHRKAQRVDHQSVAMEEIQDRRKLVVVPGGCRLHDYANLYIHARNPMMYRRQIHHRTLAVLRIRPAILDLPGVVVSDGNASSDYTRFAEAPAGLALIDTAMVFADDWSHADQIEKWRHASAKCAEVLVPDRVAPELLMGIYVSCAESRGELEELGLPLRITVDSHLFFR